MSGDSNLAITVLLVGALVVVALLIKAVARRGGVPPLVGWIGLGVVLRIVGDAMGIMTPQNDEVLRFLGKIGVICLLFGVGLESKLKELLRHLSGASLIWVGDVLISGLVGYAAARFLGGLSFISSLTIGVALTATSVGVSVEVWRNKGELETKTGETLLDVAELDDISSVVLMGFLFALLPLFTGSGDGAALGGTILGFVLKMIVFCAMCVVFARWVEKPTTRFVQSWESSPDPMISVAGIGFVVAGLAAMLNFSVALGAFFAGLAFSRDPKAVKMDASFKAIHELFTPFFFIAIGLKITLANIGLDSLSLGVILLIAAVVGKMTGPFLPALLTLKPFSAFTLAVSMIPRAEITMIVVEKAASMNALPGKAYSAMVVVAAATCLIAPMVTRKLLPGVHHARS